jgi:hypothetical protein
MTLYTVIARVNRFPHRGYYYDNLELRMIRNDADDHGLSHEEMVADSEFSESAMFIEHELFTHEEAQELKKHLEKYKADTEVVIDEMQLPLDRNICPSDFGGCGGSADGYRFYDDSDWKGLAVTGFYDVYDQKPVAKLKSYYFAPDGGMSGAVKLDADDTRKLFAAYQKAIDSGEESKFEKVTKLEPAKKDPWDDLRYAIPYRSMLLV